ncbi:ABC transporter ATP-binding protein [Alkalicoccus luteus]|uniref:ABC transporter ATP-binding protein n=1 Tax=Alkalicoccus luteus TaxID=1237094 RepID=A0A969PT09_9BACI|nr:ABC transporter ATP-binding protein [Alkalicoccus luteus]NJP37383.1 ABC transporter ATP-binding protein [Alkalicoccus luteus]
MSIIYMHQVSKYFGQEKALDGLDVEIGSGEIYGFLGPSGAGKTTTIHLLTGQMPITDGEAEVFGKPALQMKRRENLQRIGIMTEASGLYQRLTVQENLALFAKLYGVKQPKKRIDEVLELTGMQGDHKKLASKLSKGMTQRVLFARAVLHEPELLFLDEPTAALDPASSSRIHRGLKEMRERGTTIFLTTHDMQEAETLCDRVAFLDDGRVQLSDKPKLLRQAYADGTISVELKDGSAYSLQQTKDDAAKLADWIGSGRVAEVKTNLPTLGDIFIQTTGRELV